MARLSGIFRVAQRHHKDPYKERGRQEKQSQRRCGDGPEVGVTEAENGGQERKQLSEAGGVEACSGQRVCRCHFSLQGNDPEQVSVKRLNGGVR